MKRFLGIDSWWVVAALLVGFAVSRVLVRIWLGMSPDASILENHWQHADLAWLYNNFWQTIRYLHSQPPLWNAGIGAVTQLVGPDVRLVAQTISLCFSAMSLVMMFAFVGIARRAGFSVGAAAGIGLMIATSPTMIYYENYPFYPHFAAFFVTGLFVVAMHLEKTGFAPLVALFVLAAALSWTWAVFHPAFIVVLGGLCLMMYPATRSLAGVAVIVLATLIAQAPGLWNKAVFGQDFASSWLGINLTQTLPNRSEDLQAYCKFETVVDALETGEGFAGLDVSPVGVTSVDAMTKPSSGYANMNNQLVSMRAAECFDIYLQQVPQDPAAYLAHFGVRLVASHSTPPFIYAFRPEGWDVTAWVDRAYYRFGVLSETASVLYYLVLIAYGLWRLRREQDRRIYVFALYVILYFTFVTHFANGGEQQRMRVAIEPLYWVLLIGMMSDIKAWRANRRRAQYD